MCRPFSSCHSSTLLLLMLLWNLQTANNQTRANKTPQEKNGKQSEINKMLNLGPNGANRFVRYIGTTHKRAKMIWFWTRTTVLFAWICVCRHHNDETDASAMSPGIAEDRYRTVAVDLGPPNVTSSMPMISSVYGRPIRLLPTAAQFVATNSNQSPWSQRASVHA